MDQDRLRVDINVLRRTLTVSIIQPGVVAAIELSAENGAWFVSSLVEALAHLQGSAIIVAPHNPN